MSDTVSVPAHVMSEVVDGEAIIIHGITGAYFTLDRAGSAVWQHLLDAAPFEAMVAAFAAHRSDPDPEAVVGAFLRRLAEEDLLTGPVPDAPAGAAPIDAERLPTIARYDDMEELLMIDPIHDVDEAGWPIARPE